MKYFVGILSLYALFFIGCSEKKSAEDLFNEGEKYLEESKFPEAVSSYGALINKHPADSLAIEATLRLASIYQNKQVKNIPETQSLLKSVELFRSIYEKYPNSEKAPMGLFMAGFVEANELQDSVSATATYNLFLEKFPDHELATSAREELNNMGLTPEEILKKNMASE